MIFNQFPVICISPSLHFWSWRRRSARRTTDGAFDDPVSVSGRDTYPQRDKIR